MRARNALMLSTAMMLVLGCSGQPEAQQTQTDDPAATAPSHEAAVQNPDLISGTVLETMDAASYTYIRVDTGDGEVWAAASQFDVEVGEQVTFPPETPMQGFHSASLDRTFDLIYFVSVVGREGVDPQSSEKAGLNLPEGHPSLDGFKVDPAKVAAASIQRPAESLMIADVWKQRSELADSSVTVSGQVVKYNAGILGKNWFHIQDGSGELEQGTNDLTVTTDADLAVGDIVTATGTLAIDRDFGAGYTYTVILEGATVSKQ